MVPGHGGQDAPASTPEFTCGAGVHQLTVYRGVFAGPEGAVVVVCDAAAEMRGRRQFHASEVVLSHLKDATGSHTLSAAQRATLGVNSAYFSQQDSMASHA